MEEHEHWVHLFGSKPSPTISNNTLRKNAEANADDFSPAVGLKLDSGDFPKFILST
jgi:hypothetical protein